jgi:hypothetical protein
MEPRKAYIDNLIIHEEIQSQWSDGKAALISRCFVAFEGAIEVGRLRFTECDEVVRLLELAVDDGAREYNVALRLFACLPVAVSKVLFEPHPSVEVTETFQQLICEHHANPGHAVASGAVEAFLQMCSEAEVAIRKVQATSALGARLETYARYPYYLQRERELARLKDILASTPRFLYRLKV